ncbi:hypothetical protein ILYODFUR_028625 [Ilyodon furcidens]|uniref:Uncharacterized protein n=1 Tax=Ilyodon furcidens TaxID=33524 RepID=A0ABV0V6W7_9TELE
MSHKFINENTLGRKYNKYIDLLYLQGVYCFCPELHDAFPHIHHCNMYITAKRPAWRRYLACFYILITMHSVSGQQKHLPAGWTLTALHTFAFHVGTRLVKFTETSRVIMMVDRRHNTVQNVASL